MPTYEEMPHVTPTPAPEVIRNPDPHTPEKSPMIVDVEEFLRQQEGVNKKEKPKEKPTLQ